MNTLSLRYTRGTVTDSDACDRKRIKINSNNYRGMFVCACERENEWASKECEKRLIHVETKWILNTATCGINYALLCSYTNILCECSVSSPSSSSTSQIIDSLVYSLMLHTILYKYTHNTTNSLHFIPYFPLLVLCNTIQVKWKW